MEDVDIDRDIGVIEAEFGQRDLELPPDWGQ
jgi:hypothetical protein